MSTAPIEAVAAALGELVTSVVFVGEATMTLWVNDRDAPAGRAASDVDAIVDAWAPVDRDARYARLRDHGFDPDPDGREEGRWHDSARRLTLNTSGTANRWDRQGARKPAVCTLPSGIAIRAIAPAYLLASRLEEFASRVQLDPATSREFADIIALAEYRPELADEVANADEDVRRFIARAVDDLLARPRFADGLFASRNDTASRTRAESIVLPALWSLAAFD